MSSSDPAEIIAVAQGEAERRMSDLSVPGGANSHGKGRLSARGNWHTRLRIGIMGGTFDPIHNGLYSSLIRKSPTPRTAI